MQNLILHTHLGLGDHLLCNAIVRDRATKFRHVFIPCYPHNLASVNGMFSDLENVRPVRFDESITAHHLMEEDIGAEGPGGFNSQIFDQEFYRQAGLPFDLRWSGFKIPEGTSRFLPLLDPYLFLHDDTDRSMYIRGQLLPDNLPFRSPALLPSSPSILAFVDLIKNATEIHCIDSSFAILADSLTGLKATRKVIHRYARPGGVYPTYRNGWEIIE